MNTPNLINAEEIYKSECQTEINGKWCVARPMGMQGFFFWRRLKMAYEVFIGKYDALKWEGQ